MVWYHLHVDSTGNMMALDSGFIDVVFIVMEAGDGYVLPPHAITLYVKRAAVQLKWTNIIKC